MNTALFVVKKIVGVCLMPLTFALVVFIGGLLLRVLGYRRAGRVTCWSAMAVAWLATLGIVGNGLLWPLEAQYAAVVNVSATSPRYIAVLGSGYRPRDDLPITATLDATALTRIVEGVRLWRQIPGASLIVSGGGFGRYAAAARGYEKAAQELGVPADAIVRMDEPLDTAAEVRGLRQLLGDQSVLLVTSASHMPRAMAHCQRMGVWAVAAPTGHLSEPPFAAELSSWVLPSGVHLRRSETALHEYFGLLALRMGIS